MELLFLDTFKHQSAEVNLAYDRRKNRAHSFCVTVDYNAVCLRFKHIPASLHIVLQALAVWLSYPN